MAYKQKGWDSGSPLNYVPYSKRDRKQSEPYSKKERKEYDPSSRKSADSHDPKKDRYQVYDLKAARKKRRAERNK
tara:strand:+ start:1726 stop:1950 length:225 start_codon:yes stop_codon:yes gene_type:complete